MEEHGAGLPARVRGLGRASRFGRPGQTSRPCQTSLTSLAGPAGPAEPDGPAGPTSTDRPVWLDRPVRPSRAVQPARPDQNSSPDPTARTLQGLHFSEAEIELPQGPHLRFDCRCASTPQPKPPPTGAKYSLGVSWCCNDGRLLPK